MFSEPDRWDDGENKLIGPWVTSRNISQQVVVESRAEIE